MPFVPIRSLSPWKTPLPSKVEFGGKYLDEEWSMAWGAEKQWSNSEERVVSFLARMMETNTELHWPSYFSANDIRALNLGTRKRRRAIPNLLSSWRGEYVMLLWRGAQQWSREDILPADWDD
ncbi:hypothetical protein FRC03_002711, partial [Tulasnella sp. 419]